MSKCELQKRPPIRIALHDDSVPNNDQEFLGSCNGNIHPYARTASIHQSYCYHAKDAAPGAHLLRSHINPNPRFLSSSTNRHLDLTHEMMMTRHSRPWKSCQERPSLLGAATESGHVPNLDSPNVHLTQRLFTQSFSNFPDLSSPWCHHTDVISL